MREVRVEVRGGTCFRQAFIALVPAWSTPGWNASAGIDPNQALASCTSDCAADATSTSISPYRSKSSWLASACMVRDANVGHHLAGGNSSWCPELESRTTRLLHDLDVPADPFGCEPLPLEHPPRARLGLLLDQKPFNKPGAPRI